MKVIIHTMTATTWGGLAPAPSVRDCDEMKEIFAADATPRFTSMAEFIGAPLELLTTYRGWLIYLAGGVSLHRTNPSTDGGNGYCCLPDRNVTEKAIMQWDGVYYEIDAEFVV
jgi:hypothetical protein